MKTLVGQKASIPNPALKPFEVLIGTWQTTGSHPYLSDVVLKGTTSFEWIGNGAFLEMRTEIDHEQIPDGYAIFGSDNGAGTFHMIYFDERGISRKFDVSLEGNTIRWWRNDPAFSQRVITTIEDGGNKLVSVGEMCKEGADWEGDLSLTYTKI